MLARALIGLVAALWLAALGRDGLDRWVAGADLPVVLREVSVEVRGRNGGLLRVYPVADGLVRLAVTPKAVDPAFLDMLIRYEDKRFWRHGGVDPLALLRAAGQAALNGSAVSGGSTLTMQVARLLEDGPTGRWAGKARQIRLALALERRLSKAEILTLYLTHAPYGGNLEGVRAASLAWFGKEPGRLTPAQAALLVALPQSPERRRPDRHPGAARAARDRVLTRLAGQGALPRAQARAALRAEVPQGLRPFARLAPHLGDALRADHPGAGRFDLTIDEGLQGQVEALARRAARGAGQRLSAAVIVADHRSGDILASVGSAGYAAGEGRAGFVDMTRALRSPGSLLKPLVYGLAFDRGLAHPETLIRDAPVQFGSYAPRNFDGRFRGDVRVREALQQSLNIPVVKLTEALGPARLVAGLERSGASPAIPGGKAGLAVALGGLGMRLHDLVQLYGALAAGGQGRALRVTRLKAGGPEPAQVMSPEAAWQVGHILAGLAPPPGAPRGALAYKTGTSYGHRDAWAIGYDGAHVIGVWLGRADGTPVPGAFGGDLAAPVLFEVFGRLKPGFDRLAPPPPATLIAGTAELPPPLRRFRGDRDEAAEGQPLRLVFPPDGARLALDGGALVVKLRGGAEPFSVLADGAPVVLGARGQAVEVPNPGPGFSHLTVLDSRGASARVTVQVE